MAITYRPLDAIVADLSVLFDMEQDRSVYLPVGVRLYSDLQNELRLMAVRRPALAKHFVHLLLPLRARVVAFEQSAHHARQLRFLIRDFLFHLNGPRRTASAYLCGPGLTYEWQHRLLALRQHNLSLVLAQAMRLRDGRLFPVSPFFVCSHFRIAHNGKTYFIRHAPKQGVLWALERIRQTSTVAQGTTP